VKLNLNDLINFSAKVFGVDASLLNSDTSIHNFEQWDSLNHIKLILNLESKYQIKFTPLEIDEIDSLGNILSLLSRKLSL
jgi:acyl carrier protein